MRFRKIRSSCGKSGEYFLLGVIPLLASPQGGVAASSKKYCEATETDAAGVVFLFCRSENHPGLAVSGGSATFINRSATPPCSDARRGIGLIAVGSQLLEEALLE